MPVGPADGQGAVGARRLHGEAGQDGGGLGQRGGVLGTAGVGKKQTERFEVFIETVHLSGIYFRFEQEAAPLSLA